MNFMQLCEFVLHWNWNMNLKTVMNFVITKAISVFFFLVDMRTSIFNSLSRALQFAFLYKKDISQC